MPESDLHADVRSLRDTYQSRKSSLQKLKRISQGLGAVFIVVLLAFLAGLYSRAADMYAPEKFVEPLQKEAQVLLPKLEPELRTLWDETAPVYVEMATEKLQLALPELQERSQKEMELFLTSLSANAERQIHGALNRVVARQQQVFEEQFPALATQDGLRQVGNRWVSTLESDAEDVILHFHDSYVTDLGELAETLDQFRSSEFEGMSDEELARQFVHLWLLKLDRWVMEGDEGVPLERAVGDDHEG